MVSWVVFKLHIFIRIQFIISLYFVLCFTFFFYGCVHCVPDSQGNVTKLNFLIDTFASLSFVNDAEISPTKLSHFSVIICDLAK